MPTLRERLANLSWRQRFSLALSTLNQSMLTDVWRRFTEINSEATHEKTLNLNRELSALGTTEGLAAGNSFSNAAKSFQNGKILEGVQNTLSGVTSAGAMIGCNVAAADAVQTKTVLDNNDPDVKNNLAAHIFKVGVFTPAAINSAIGTVAAIKGGDTVDAIAKVVQVAGNVWQGYVSVPKVVQAKSDLLGYGKSVDYGYAAIGVSAMNLAASLVSALHQKPGTVTAEDQVNLLNQQEPPAGEYGSTNAV